MFDLWGNPFCGILCGGGKVLNLPTPRPAPFARRSAKKILGLTLTPGLPSNQETKLLDCCWKLEGSAKWVEEDMLYVRMHQTRGWKEKDVECKGGVE